MKLLSFTNIIALIMGFTIAYVQNYLGNKSAFPDDALVKVYYSALGIFGLYLLMKMFTRK